MSHVYIALSHWKRIVALLQVDFLLKILQLSDNVLSFDFIYSSHRELHLKEHVALDRSSWSLKRVCNRFL